jgi:hypothetical protein
MRRAKKVVDSSETSPRDGAGSSPRAGTTPETVEASDGDAASAGGGNSLEDAARDGREVAGARLREELGREPTEAEIDDWLQRQTEGY